MIRQGRKADVRTLKCSTSQVISPNGLTAGEYIARCAAEAVSLRPEDVGRYAQRGYPARLETRTQSAAGAAPVASGWSGRRWALHPLDSAALSRRTPRFGHLAPDIAVAHNRSLTGGESARSLGLPPL